jgi:hypothetical protein
MSKAHAAGATPKEICTMMMMFERQRKQEDRQNEDGYGP